MDRASYLIGYYVGILLMGLAVILYFWLVAALRRSKERSEQRRKEFINELKLEILKTLRRRRK